MIKNGCVHVYYGDGKGKTTASVGLLMRCVGSGLKAAFTSFLKNYKSCELSAMSGIDIICDYPMDYFWFELSEKERKEFQEKYKRLFIKLEDICGKYDIIVLDEVLNAVSTGAVEEEMLIEFIKNKPESLEIVLTGSTMTDRIFAVSDYVTEMRCVKHPYKNGQCARVGIEL